MDEGRVRSVVGRDLPRRPAVLEGFERTEPPRGYPWVVAQEGATVAGILLDDVDDAALARLDAYEDEGGLYLRRDAAAVADGRRVPCQVYVGNNIREARGRA